MERLRNFPFRDVPRGERELGALARQLPADVSTRLALLLAASAAPEQALHSVTRLCENHPAVFNRVARSTGGLQAVVAVFAQSRFLTEAILQHPEWTDDLLDSSALQTALGAEEVRAQLFAA